MLEKGEVFDSTQLKDTVNSLIAAGKRNFAIDLSPFDYIYSDAINVILAINRRILDVSGRLSLMSPNQEVKSILERAGLHNILKIYENEADLLKSSEDIILQTTRFNLSDLKNYQEPKPKSEFEDFRSEISTAMDPQKPDQFNSLESEIPEDNFTAQQPRKQQPQQSMEEQFIPPAPPPTPPRQQGHPFEGPSGQRRTETSIPQKQPPRQAPAQKAFKSEEMDTFETQSPVREAPARPKQQRPAKMSEREFDRMNEDEEDYEEEKPKNTLVPIIIGVIILCVLGIGGFIGFSIITKKGPKETKVATVQQQAPNAIPELAQPVEQAQPAQPAVSSTAENNKTQEQAAPAETETQPAEKKTSARPSAAQPKQTESAKKTTSKISINSKPSGATVIADGKEIGTTPCKYTDPPLGTINLVLSKQGYSDATKTIDYTGGNITQHILLTRLPKENQASVKTESSNSAAENATPPSSRVAAEPSPRPEPVAPSSSGGDAATIFISSMPPVAEVYMDGKLIGKTNISKLNVTTGSHSMKFVKGSVEVTEDLTFKPGDNPSHLVIMKK